MIESPIHPSLVNLAHKLAKKIGVLNNSIQNGEGNLPGVIGELIVAQYINGVLTNTYDYDIISPKGFKIDVKTKLVTSTPQPHYYCSVADYNTRQNCDFYVFTRVLKNLKTGWILGILSKEEFYSKAVFYKKGEIDPESHSQFTFRADCYNIKIAQLKKIKIMP